ncbi:MAG: hypothetical protein A2Y21_09865 [Clostridiales bacterium GWC2_40_7]|nr:MAG: hypothetical protein A2Y21_09865 [Clostridiales bacterium GWC2_40_7]
MVEKKALNRVPPGEVAGQAIIYVFAIFFSIIFIYPFLNVIAKSLSGEIWVMAGEVGIIPKEVHLNAYRYVLSSQRFYRALGNSVFVTLVGSFCALFIVSLTAYVLSRNSFRYRNIVLKMYIFIMIFHGGVIPGFILVKSLGLIDTYLALILPAIVNPFYLLIMRSFMKAIPDSLEESAKIDGATHIQILFNIMLPVCKPALASVLLFFAVDYWNDFFRPLIYIKREKLFTLQLYLRSILIDEGDLVAELDPAAFANTAAKSVQNATIIVSTIPILIAYPLLQRYFVTGITLGSIKG